MTSVVNVTWAKDASGFFDVAANWSPGTSVPNADDYVIFAAMALPYTVTVAALQPVAGFSNGKRVTLDILSDGVLNVGGPAANAGLVKVRAGGLLSIGGASAVTYENAGVTALNGSAAAVATFNVNGPEVDLIGGGTFRLSNNANNYIGAEVSGRVLVNFDNTIVGAGTIGGDDHLQLQNGADGTINADDSVALTLFTGSKSIRNSGLIETTGAGGLVLGSSLVNGGTLLAAGLGALTIDDEAIVSGAGLVRAVSGSTIVLDQGLIEVAGEVILAKGSRVLTAAQSLNDALQTGDLENAGSISVTSGSALALGGFIHNSGSIALNAASSVTQIEIAAGGVTLSGAGRLTLTDNLNNRVVSNGVAATLTNAGNLISGSGTLGDWNLTIANVAGVIKSNGAKGLTIVGSNNTNQALIETTGAGGLILESLQSNNGVLEALGSGALDIKNVYCPNGVGTIETGAAGAKIVLDTSYLAGNQTVSLVANSTLTAAAGTVDGLQQINLNNAGALVVQNGANLALSGIMYNNGAIDVDATTKATILQVTWGGMVLFGAGHLTLTDNVGNQILANGYNQNFTNQGNFISGSGVIGDTHLCILNMQGVIDSDGTKSLALVGDFANTDPDINGGLIETTGSGGMIIEGQPGKSANWRNYGRIDAVGSGALTLENVVFSGGAGMIETVAAGASILLDNANLSGQTFSVMAGSAATAVAGTTDTLSAAFYNAGTVFVVGAANVTTELVLGATAFNSGIVELTGPASELVVGGAATTLMSSGALELLGAGDRIVDSGSAATLTNINETISGSGVLGDATMTLVNAKAGKINANAAAALVIQTGANAVTNAGLIESTAAGGLTIVGAIENAGVLKATKGVLEVTGAVTGAGQAQIGGGAIDFAAGSNANVHFLTGGGQLQLGHSATAADAYTGEIFGFGAGDSLNLADLGSASAQASFSFAAGLHGGLLTVTLGGETSTIAFLGDYTKSSFNVVTSSGGTKIAFA